MSSFPGWTLPLRTWQEEALFFYRQKQTKSFLAVATPGAGKTLFALRVAYGELDTGRADRVVIVAPTTHLCQQWSKAASRVGINLSIFSNQKMNEPGDSHGIVTTYQSLAYNPDLYHIGAARRNTLAIIDEIHHAGDNEQLSWGPALSHAFQPAISILALSGTPFRTDNNPIPFVRYEGNISRADYTYSYAQALEDGICRPVYFPTFEGDINWVEDGEYISVTFADSLSEDMSRRRLKMAVQTPDFLREVFAQAHENLLRIRRTEQANAGGLVITAEKPQADDACRLIEQVTGIKPVKVTSDDPDSSQKIKQFSGSDAPWIVAIKMISEGVDIPRLRTMVYATNYTAQLFFIQAVGRVIRVMEGVNNPNAFVYMPKDPRLEELARTIIQEREHVLIDKERKPKIPGDGPPPPSGPVLIPHTGNAIASDTIYAGDQYGKSVLPAAEHYGKQHNVPTPILQVILDAFVNDNGLPGMTIKMTPNASPSHDDRSYQEKLDDMKQVVNTKARALVGLMMRGQYNGERFGKEMQRIWSRLRAVGFPRVDLAGYEELTQMRARIEQWMSEYQGGEND